MSSREPRLREELDAHFAALVADYRRQGMKPEEARRAARLRLGGDEQIRAAVREASRWAWLDDLRRDLALGARALRRAPGFTLVVVLSLALGIGANAAIFSLLDAALLQTLPVATPGQLALLYWHSPQRPQSLNQSGGVGPETGGESGSYSLAYPAYEYVRDHGGAVLDGVFGFAPLSITAADAALTLRGETRMTSAELVGGEFFSTLGLQPAAGRLLNAADERAGAPLAAVLSYGFWTQAYGRDAGVVGQTASLKGVPVSIVGIAPPGFQGVETGVSRDLWLAMPPTLPAGLAPWNYAPPGESIFQSGDYWWVEVMARLRPGVTREQAVAALTPGFGALTRSGLKIAAGQSLPQLAAEDGSQGVNQFRSGGAAMLWILMAVVGVLLLLACVNVAALLLARAAARRQEIAVRLALGARRERLVRQLLTESLLLALVGGAVGAALAPLGVRALLAMLGGASPLPLAAGVDGRVIGFTAVVALATGVLFGLAPALRCTRVEVGAAMQGGRSAAGERVRLGGDKALAMAQVALSVVLVAAAALFLRSLDTLQHQPLGFKAENLLVFGLNGTDAGYERARLAALYQRVEERLGAVPGVGGVTAMRLGLITGWTSNGSVSVPGVKLNPQQRQSNFNYVGPAFLATTGIGLKLGRDFTAADVGGSRPVGIVNQALAQQLFGDEPPLGRMVAHDGVSYAIVGVAANARYSSLRGRMPPTLYVPYTQSPSPLGGLTFAVRLQGGEAALLPALRAALREVDPQLAMSEVRMQDEQIRRSLAQPRMFSRLSGFFGLLGLLLAAIGIEGTMAYAVARRRGEIGIRMALGAGRGRVLWEMARETLGLALGGIAAGLALALVCGRVLASQLYQVSPTDPGALAAAAVALLAVAVLAGWWPARRAARTDPMRALRAE